MKLKLNEEFYQGVEAQGTRPYAEIFVNPNNKERMEAYKTTEEGLRFIAYLPTKQVFIATTDMIHNEMWKIICKEEGRNFDDTFYNPAVMITGIAKPTNLRHWKVVEISNWRDLLDDHDELAKMMEPYLDGEWNWLQLYVDLRAFIDDHLVIEQEMNELADPGRKGKDFEKWLLRGFDLVGLDYDMNEKTGAVWDFRTIGDAWSDLLDNGVDVNIKIAPAKFLFSSVILGKDLPWFDLDMDEWDDDKARKIVQYEFDKKGIADTVFLKPKDEQIQKQIISATRRKDVETLRSLFKKENFGYLQLGDDYEIDFNLHPESNRLGSIVVRKDGIVVARSEKPRTTTSGSSTVMFRQPKRKEPKHKTNVMDQVTEQKLNEKWLISFNHHFSGKDQTVEVFKNPSSKEFLDVIKSAKYGEAKMIARNKGGKKDLYIFNSDLANHTDVWPHVAEEEGYISEKDLDILYKPTSPKHIALIIIPGRSEFSNQRMVMPGVGWEAEWPISHLNKLLQTDWHWISDKYGVAITEMFEDELMHDEVRSPPLGLVVPEFNRPPEDIRDLMHKEFIERRRKAEDQTKKEEEVIRRRTVSIIHFLLSNEDMNPEDFGLPKDFLDNPYNFATKEYEDFLNQIEEKVEEAIGLNPNALSSKEEDSLEAYLLRSGYHSLNDFWSKMGVYDTSTTSESLRVGVHEEFAFGGDVTGRYTEVFKNPTKKEMFEAGGYKLQKDVYLRFVADGNKKNLYVFPAYILHRDIWGSIAEEDGLPYDDYEDPTLISGTAIYRKGTWYFDESDALYNENDDAVLRKVYRDLKFGKWDWVNKYIDMEPMVSWLEKIGDMLEIKEFNMVIKKVKLGSSLKENLRKRSRRLRHNRVDFITEKRGMNGAGTHSRRRTSNDSIIQNSGSIADSIFCK